MITSIRRKTTGKGFTLIELAIVLAVTGVLFIGLYRLLSGGNQQVKDTATASQQIQLINAVKTFLASTQGQLWMSEAPHNVSFATYNLPLPTTANCAGSPVSDANLQTFCTYLPAGFYAGTVNPYGQTYTIQVLNGAVTPPATAPASYSFLIVTNATANSDIISDASGGRISSQIGGDGGFIYSNANVCATGNACGAYGGWTVALATYGVGSPGSGHVASRTYYSPEIGSLTPWLARQFMPGDSASSPDYNSMHTDFYLGTNQGSGLNNTFWLGSVNAATSGGGTMNVQGGTITLSTGEINDAVSPGDAITIATPLPPASPGYLSKTAGGRSGSGSNAFETLNSGCTVTSTTTPDCQNTLQINGDANVTGQLQAGTLFAGTFIYQQSGGSSDIRLKTNVQPMPSALDSVMRMKPVSYAFKSDGQKSMGFIAQDMEKIYPDLVMQGTDGMKAIKYDGLIAPLVASVQELKKENDELKQELHESMRREEALEKRVK